jgi:hypothetical protein
MERRPRLRRRLRLTTVGAWLWSARTRRCRPMSGTYARPPNVCRQNWMCCVVSVEELAVALNRISAAAGPYLVGVWIGCVMVGGLYSYLLLRRARIDQERLRGQGVALEYSAESTAGRVWIRTKTFLEFLGIGVCAVLLEVPGGIGWFLLVKAVARLAYLLLFINVILELAYNAWRDSTRDGRLRVMLHDIRQKLADAVQPHEGEGEVPLDPGTEADAVHTDTGDAG